jgi:hypothetical protein
MFSYSLALVAEASAAPTIEAVPGHAPPILQFKTTGRFISVTIRRGVLNAKKKLSATFFSWYNVHAIEIVPIKTRMIVSPVTIGDSGETADAFEYAT